MKLQGIIWIVLSALAEIPPIVSPGFSGHNSYRAHVELTGHGSAELQWYSASCLIASIHVLTLL